MKKTMISLLLLILAVFVGTGAISAQTPEKKGSLRIISYNIRNCTGMDNVMDIDRLAVAVNLAAPDLIAFQELDSAAMRTRRLYILGELASRTGMYPVYGPAFDYQGGKYGVGLLSREKPLGYKVYRMPEEKSERRVFLLVEFESYYMGSTHLALDSGERMRSIPIIVEAVSELGKPVFVAGDFNARPGSPELEALAVHFTLLTDTSLNTFPADEPDICIDYIFARIRDGETYTLLGNGVIDEPMASDHRPVYADLEF